MIPPGCLSATPNSKAARRAETTTTLGKPHTLSGVFSLFPLYIETHMVPSGPDPVVVQSTHSYRPRIRATSVGMQGEGGFPRCRRVGTQAMGQPAHPLQSVRHAVRRLPRTPSSPGDRQ